MFAKLAALVMALGACGCALLAMRQSRLQAASELTQAQLRIQAADERLWALRAQIAERTTPRRVREMAADVGPMRPILADTASYEAVESHVPSLIGVSPDLVPRKEPAEAKGRGIAGPTPQNDSAAKGAKAQPAKKPSEPRVAKKEPGR